MDGTRIDEKIFLKSLQRVRPDDIVNGHKLAKKKLQVLSQLEDISDRLFRADANIKTSILFLEIDDSTFKEEYNQVEFYRGELIKYRFKCEFFLEKQEKSADYKAWLTGQNEKLKDKEIASSMKHLKDYWSDPELDGGLKFLGDCLLNNRYLNTENKDYIPTYGEIVQDLSDDKNELENQEDFEHKYNFRFEESDQEFTRRYPRTFEGSSRSEDNKRKLKRQEVKERKAREKAEKLKDLKKLRDIKRIEIEEEIKKLKEITGNQEIVFDDGDIDEDFNPEAHDKRMQALFNDDYYKNGPEDDIKPSIDIHDEDGAELQPNPTK